MKIDLSTVGISCVACGRKINLEEAIQAGWRQCMQCQFFIDPNCVEIVKETMGGICPSFSQGVTRHALQPVDVPTEQILIFVKDQYQQGLVGNLIETIFYSSSTRVEEPIRPPRSEPSEGDSLTREEVWKRYGLVLVQRARGKWLAWEKVGTTS
ncbi:MAG: hypothetical protein ACFFCO_04665 [Promethearchaeota archaeon]